MSAMIESLSADKNKLRGKLRTGTLLRGYVIDSVLGYGGFGIVYGAHHEEVGYPIALKEFLPADLSVREGDSVRPRGPDCYEYFEDGKRRFLEEAKQLVQFRRDPGVVSCLDFFRANGTAYLVMEHVEGLSLAELLHRREESGSPLDETQMVSVMVPLVEALSRVHAAGVLHRDIKPSNILIQREDGRPVLIDFGAAKQNAAQHSKSLAPLTEGYAAIEQVGGGDLGPWTDLYGVGAVMWRIVAGANPPWDPPTPVSVVRRMHALVRNDSDPLPSAIIIGDGKFAHQVLQAIDKCLRIQEVERFQTCQELLDELQRAISLTPRVNEVMIINSPSNGYAYRADEAIDIRVKFSTQIETSGTPLLALKVGSRIRRARFHRHNVAEDTLLFRYVVHAEDTAEDGISIAADALSVDGGSIRGEAGTSAILDLGSHSIVGETSSRVDGRIVMGPKVSEVEFLTRPKGSTYRFGERILIGVQFNEWIETTDNSRLALNLMVGNRLRKARFSKKSLTKVTFLYRVQADDVAKDGVCIGADALSLSGGSIQGIGGTPAVLELGSHAFKGVLKHKVDGSIKSVPEVEGLEVRSRPSNGTAYEAGEEIEVWVTFDMPIKVNGNPQLALNIGDRTCQAAFSSTIRALGKFGTRIVGTLSFRYVVKTEDIDANGISVSRSALTLNGGSIRSPVSAPAALGLGPSAIRHDSDHKVDGSIAKVPQVKGVQVSSRPSNGTAYGAGEEIKVRIDFDLPIKVAGSPQLALNLGDRMRQACHSASSKNGSCLYFGYLVQAGDTAPRGIAVDADALSLNGGSIRSTVAVPAVLGLHTHAIRHDSSHKVDGSIANVPQVSEVEFLTRPKGSTYRFGERILIGVQFNEWIETTDNSRLALNLMVGDRLRKARFSEKSVAGVIFLYRVQADDVAKDGIHIGADALSLNGGSIQGIGGIPAVLELGSLAVKGVSKYKVDGSIKSVPEVEGLEVRSRPSNGTAYEAGEEIEVWVTFDLPIKVNGSPQLALDIGGHMCQAEFSYTSHAVAKLGGRLGSTLAFRYVVKAEDIDANGISVSRSALTLNGGSIRSPVGAPAVLGLGPSAIRHDTDHKVDGGIAKVPQVKGVQVSSRPSNGTAYGAGEEIKVRVNFDLPIKVTGTPRLALKVGDRMRQACCSASSVDESSLWFGYLVQAEDTAPGGIAVGADALSLNGGSIRSTAAAPALLGLDPHTIRRACSHKVDGSIATAPRVKGLHFFSRPSNGSAYGAGEEIELRVDFDQRIKLTGSPQLEVKVGDRIRWACCSASSVDESSLYFGYRVQEEDTAPKGIAIAAGALTLNGGIVLSSVGASVVLDLGTHAIRHALSHKVDGSLATAPKVNYVSVSSNPSNGSAYGAGEEIELRVDFDLRIKVTGRPQLAIEMGGRTCQAAYSSFSRISGSIEGTLFFRYLVKAEDTAPEGIAIAADALTLNGGSIRSPVGAPAVLDLNPHAIQHNSTHKVNGGVATAPEVSYVWVSDPLTGTAYGAGEKIVVGVEFTVPVKVSGVPLLALDVGGHARQASFEGRDFGSTLRFRYRVHVEDLAPEGITIAADALTLNGGYIRSTTGTAAVLYLGSVDNMIIVLDGPRVDGSIATVPQVQGLRVSSRPSNGTAYGAGEEIEVRVDFDLPLEVTGLPQLALEIGGRTCQSVFSSSWGGRLSFRYQVKAEDMAADGISVSRNALTFNGGNIRSPVGASAVLDLGTHVIRHASSHKVDGSIATAPRVQGLRFFSRPSNGTAYGAGEEIEIRVDFDQRIKVTGIPQLELKVGDRMRQACYSVNTVDESSLYFGYRVQAEDMALGGIAIAADALTLNGGSILSRAAVPAVLGLDPCAVQHESKQKVDGGIAAVPQVKGLRVTTRPSNGTAYGAGEEIEIRVDFDQRTTVIGIPQLKLNVGDRMRQACYSVSSVSGSSLYFGYRVQAEDTASGGIAIAADALTLNGGSIRSTASVPAVLGLDKHAIRHDSSQRVDGGIAKVPQVKGLRVSSRPSNGTAYGAGERISVFVHFTVPVEVTGTPRLVLNVGECMRNAPFRSISNDGISMCFEYRVQAGDAAPEGIAITPDALCLNAGCIRSTVGISAVLDLASPVRHDSRHRVDGSIAPEAKNIGVYSSPLDGSAYGAGEKIKVGVAFTMPIVVTGSPQLSLEIGNRTRYASFESQIDAVIWFRYQVQPEDLEREGIRHARDALTLNGGTIRGIAGAVAVLDLVNHCMVDDLILSKLDDSPAKVDGSIGTVPRVQGLRVSSLPSNGTVYGEGEEIEARVDFDQRINVTGIPQLELKVGERTRQSCYSVRGVDGSSMYFGYRVQAEDTALRGISIAADALSLNGGSIRSTAAAPAVLGLDKHAIRHDSIHKVDGSIATLPQVKGLRVSSLPLNGTAYGAGERISVFVHFTVPVEVTGTPRLVLNVGECVRTAPCESVSDDGISMCFEYRVQAGDAAPEGIAIAPHALCLNAGCIRSTRGISPVLDLGSHNAVRHDSKHRVDGSIAPEAKSLGVYNRPLDGSAYRAGEEIKVGVGFTLPIVVTGSPALPLKIGNRTRHASFESQLDDVIWFRYLVRPEDLECEGIRSSGDALTLNGGTIRGVSGAEAVLDLGNHSMVDDLILNKWDDSPARVDGSIGGVPRVKGLQVSSLPSNGRAYGAGEWIDVFVHFTVPVEVTGMPSLILNVGECMRDAAFGFIGDDGTSICFDYRVQAEDVAPNGIAIAPDALCLNAGCIRSTGGISAVLDLGSHNAVRHDSKHRVDGSIAPEAKNLGVYSRPLDGLAYGTGEKIKLGVGFTLPIMVTGHPQLSLKIGNRTRYASFESQVNDVIWFRYVVQPEDLEREGIRRSGDALTLNGGTIRGVAGAEAVLDLGNNPMVGDLILSKLDDSPARVDGSIGTVPRVKGLRVSSRPSNGTAYGAGEEIEVRVDFDQRIKVTGNPKLELKVGECVRQAWHSVSSVDECSLYFGYRVQAEDTAPRGIAIAADALSFNGGSIRSTAAVPVVLGLDTHAIRHKSSHKVDGSIATVPHVTGLRVSSRPSNGTAYGAGEEIEVRVDFDLPIKVTGMPQLALKVGERMRRAWYSVSSVDESSLYFGYHVQAEDTAPEGIAIAADALTLNSGSIRSMATAPAVLNLGTHAIQHDSQHKVDGST